MFRLWAEFTVPGAMSQPTVSVLKEDSLGRVERVEGEGGVVLRRVACGGRLPGSGWLARRLLVRERKALERLAGLDGFPELMGPGELASKKVLLRSFVEGAPLHRAESLPEDFFERLVELMERMHRAGVCHNDLHKEQNILVDTRGLPVLIDFQLASVHATEGRGFRVRCHEDRRHLEKHRRRYLRDGRGPDPNWQAPERLPRKPLSRLWRRTAKPMYQLFTRKILRRWDGEERRPSSGPWPEWTPPVGGWPDGRR